MPVTETTQEAAVYAKSSTATVVLPTGRLRLTVEHGPPLTDLCDFAARANPKRGFLIVSKVLGRHLPAAPAAMRRSMEDLARQLPGDSASPVVFLGMAETATALGQGVFAAFRQLYPEVDALYLQSSRQRVTGSQIIASFEEGHSHATSHLIQIADPVLAQAAREARTLVMVDDECSTGNTFVAAGEALAQVMPDLQAIHACSITDWSGGGFLARMPAPTAAVAILQGAMTWEPASPTAPPVLGKGVNRQGSAPVAGARSRTGLRWPEVARRDKVAVSVGERILVLGDGEHSYEALLVAEEIEAQGGIAAVQCITRSPALVGGAMESLTRLSDAYGSGAECYLYNLLRHRPERIVIVVEIEKQQRAEIKAALTELGVSLQVDFITCAYEESAG